MFKKIIRFNWQNIIVAFVLIILLIIINKYNLYSISTESVIDLINYNSIIAGFLFTAASILVSTLSKDRFKRLTKYKFMDKYYFAVFTALIVSVIAIIINFICLYLKVIVIDIVFIQKLIISLTLISSLYFIQSIYFLIKLFKKIYKDIKDDQY